MPEKKMNWGTLVIGIIIGLVIMWIINAYSKPAVGQEVSSVDPLCIKEAVRSNFDAGRPCFSRDEIGLCEQTIADAIVLGCVMGAR